MSSDAQRIQRRGRTVRGRQARLTTPAAKDKLVANVTEGMTVKAALEDVGYAYKTYEEWRRKDEKFRARVDQARMMRKPREVKRGERLDFVTWRKKYLGISTPLHQQQWVDLIEGREPRDLHPAQTFERGTSSNRILINCPPFHGKSIALTVDYSTYRLCMDPGYRILIISAGAELAKQFLFGIKERLTSPDFMELQKAYAPDGGWEATSESWTESKITFSIDQRSGSDRDSHEKDPNVQAIGMNGKIYGRRADLIIVDDGVDETNVSAYAKQMAWLSRTVLSRLELGGRLVMVGTRIAPVDLYSELLRPENYANGRVPWTYLASPAILEEGKTPAEHVTLWPYADFPWVRKDPSGVLQDECICGEESCADGLMVDGEKKYARWDGVHLEKGPRADNTATMWALVYQQKSIDENSTFPEHAVRAATNTQRLCGRLEADRVGHPLGGMHGKYIIAGLDPSIKGFAGIVVAAVSRETNKRYVLAAFNLKAPTAEELKAKMRELTEHYEIDEWRVEKTGLLQFFTQDAVLRSWFATRGVRFTEHQTGSNKWDPMFGVSSMASLFGEYDRAWDDPNGNWRTITEPLVELPRANQEGMKAFVHQLLTWSPDLDPAKVPCDLVMAFWFMETGAREHLGVGRSNNVVSFGARRNKFVSPRRKNQYRVSLADYRPTDH